MCGIAGIINQKKNKLNKPVLNILGIANDSRGGDSCGIFIDGKVEYGVDKEKKYADFFYVSKLLQETKECKTAFVHCRKASVGRIALETAQPVVIKEDDVVKYCLMHNGTIHNYEALAKKYIPDIDIKGMTDSQVMARIFYYKGYDVLSEYNGGAVFAIADYREDADNPKILFWKGESKDYAGSQKPSEERPFFFAQTKVNFVFSSIPLQLDAIYGDENVLTIRSNALIELKDNSLSIVKEYDRSKCQQTKTYVSNYNYASNTRPKSNTNTSSYTGTGLSTYMYQNLEGDYMLKGEKMHGKSFCSAHGVSWESDFKATNAMWAYFYNGVLLFNKECFGIIEDIRKEMSKQNAKYLNYREFHKDYPEIVGYFSYTPLKITNDKYFEVTPDLMWEVFTGQFSLPFHSYKRCECENGRIKSTKYSSALEAFTMFKTVSESFQFDKIAFINTVNELYNVSIKP